VGREFKGLYSAIGYRPFPDTNVIANLEIGWIDEVRPDGMLVDAFSTTERTAATTAYAVTTGGFTLFAGNGRIYNTVSANTRRSAGTNISVTDENILPREINFLGPDSTFDQKYRAINLRADQKIGENLALQLAGTLSRLHYINNRNAGSSSTGLYLDTDRLLPDGTSNPKVNRYYTESYTRITDQTETVNDLRLNAVYDLKLPFTTQRIVALGVLKVHTPDTKNYTEINDPATPFWKPYVLRNYI